MSEPLRSEVRATELPDEAERAARIEQLLLSGLDHYFAGDYDQAINRWSRVLFLDRHHDRARAYIERARSAQAERQRESEALLHQGLQAFEDGSVDRARQLLSSALHHGASHDLALGVLDRIDRLDPPMRPTRSTSQPDAEPRLRIAADLDHRHERRRPMVSSLWLIALFVVAIAAAGAWEMSLDELTAWARWPGGDAAFDVPAARTPFGAPAPLPSATIADLPLSRAQAHYAAGRLRDAWRALEAVPPGSPLAKSADALRGDIQRALLAAADATIPPAPQDRARE